MTVNGGYPRPLRPVEIEYLHWVLPEESPGYGKFREFIARSVAIGRGRRGEGEIILGPAGAEPDLSAPLPPVQAYGVLETSEDTISVTVRDIIEGQMSIEIVGQKADAVNEQSAVIRRWTFSTWRPGMPCPQCGLDPRIVEIAPRESSSALHAIAFCAADRRFWIFDGTRITCAPNSVTIFYNELMMLKNIRDPKIALDGKNLYRDLAKYSDAELAAAFAAYNRMKGKVEIASGGPLPSGGRGSLLKRIGTIFQR